MKSMTIGHAAKAAGVSAKMIRHYEEIGLLGKAQRTEAGYRVYTDNDIHMLRFVRQARGLGFSMAQIKTLLSLWKNQRRSSSKVKELAVVHMQSIDERIRELQDMRQTLAHLVQHCHGDDRPECPILDGMAHTA